jgi:hypothetical protein
MIGNLWLQARYNLGRWSDYLSAVSSCPCWRSALSPGPPATSAAYPTTVNERPPIRPPAWVVDASVGPGARVPSRRILEFISTAPPKWQTFGTEWMAFGASAIRPSLAAFRYASPSGLSLYPPLSSPWSRGASHVAVSHREASPSNPVFCLHPTRSETRPPLKCQDICFPRRACEGVGTAPHAPPSLTGW